MRVLGIDPGSNTTGWGIVESHGRRYRVVEYGTIRTSASEKFSLRLLKISNALEELIARYGPDACAIEDGFLKTNIKVTLKLGQVRVRKIERNADDGLTRGTSPFIGEITKRTELVDALGFQFAIKLLNESFERRTLEFEPEFANRLGEYLLEFCSGFLEIVHWAIQSSIPRNQIWHGEAYRLCT